MDSPPGIGDDVADFARIDRHLLAIGLTAPQIFAEDLAQGFLLTGGFRRRRLCPADRARPAAEMPLYPRGGGCAGAAASNHPAPDLPDLSAADWAEAAAMALDWYALCGDRGKDGPREFVAALTEALTAHADGPRVMILRDYHAENLMWLPERDGVQRVGLLDFQLAQMGQPGYDLVSLLQDARRDVAADTEAGDDPAFSGLRLGGMRRQFLPRLCRLGRTAGAADSGHFRAAVSGGGQAGLCRADPAGLGAVAAQPRPARNWPPCARFAPVLPEPTPEALDRIRAQCSRSGDAVCRRASAPGWGR